MGVVGYIRLFSLECDWTCGANFAGIGFLDWLYFRSFG